MNGYVRAGVNNVHANTAVDGEINKVRPVYGAGVGWTFQLSQYVVDVLRDLAPSATGAVAVPSTTKETVPVGTQLGAAVLHEAGVTVAVSVTEPPN